MLVACWASIVDDGPTSIQHWINILCLMETIMMYTYLFFFLRTIQRLFEHWNSLTQQEASKIYCAGVILNT